MPESGQRVWVTLKTAGRILIFAGICLFVVHAFFYLTRGTVYFFPPIIAVEAILDAAPYGHEIIQWLLFPKSFEGLNRIVFAVLNHMPIWIFVIVLGLLLWAAGWLNTRHR